MNFDLNWAGFLFSVFTAAVGWLVAYLSAKKQNQALAKQRAQIEREATEKAVKKEYAAERDFAHLRRNQEQLIQNIDVLAKDFDERSDREHNELWQKFEALHRELAEIKTMIVTTCRQRPNE
jgi:uncharacterized protein YcbK (DUF882 family)